MQIKLVDLIRNVQDFPKKGIVFRDITTLIKDKDAFKEVTELLYEKCKDKEIDLIVAAESRGFIFGGALALRLGVGFVPVRKPGKLPAETISETYELEYGTDTLEMHEDAIERGQKVLIVDDLLATGGTLLATCKLVEKLGGSIVGILVLIELAFLKGKEKVKNYDFFSLIKYDQE